MFGHKAMMYKHGLFIDTGDFTGATGDFADPQGDGDFENDGETAINDDTGGETGTDDDADGDVEPAEPQVKQTPNQDRAFADLRRRAEAAENKLQTYQQKVQQHFGQTHGISDLDGYFAAVEQTVTQQQQAQQQQMAQYHQQKEQELREYGLDPNQIRDFFHTDPAFVQMQRENYQLKNQLQAQQQQAQQHQQSQQLEQVKKVVMDEHKALKGEYGELVPDAKNFDELIQKLDPAVIEKMQKGYSLEDAFTIANKAAIMKRSKSAAKQQTLNSINGKAHLKTEGDGAGDGGDVHIPPETLQMYLDQGMNKKQASAFHKRLYG